MSIRCDACGRFRKAADVIGFDAGDERTEIVVECKTCTAPANLKGTPR